MNNWFRYINSVSVGSVPAYGMVLCSVQVLRPPPLSVGPTVVLEGIPGAGFNHSWAWEEYCEMDNNLLKIFQREAVRQGLCMSVPQCPSEVSRFDAPAGGNAARAWLWPSREQVTIATLQVGQVLSGNLSVG